MKKLLIFFIILFIIYFLTSGGPTPYDYFTRLSHAFLEGKYYLTTAPPWLSELIPAGINKFYVVYPPMPAILSIPFVYIFKNFQQQILAHILGAGTAVLTMAVSYSLKKDRKLAVYSGLLIGLGSIVWFLSSVGSSWYIGQVTSAFFLTAAILATLKNKNPILIGLILGGVYLSRTHVILSLPFFLLLLKNKNNFIKNIFLLGLGLTPFVLFDAIYNILRFGVPWNQSYFILPKILNEENTPWFVYGVTNPAYIANNLKTMFLSLPIFTNSLPYIKPSWNGLSIWITTPAFLVAIFAPLKERITRLSLLAILPILLIVISHGGNGFAQFGYRFAVDFYPFLMLLVILSIKRTGLRKIHWILLFISILINFWGVIWINKFGWVSY